MTIKEEIETLKLIEEVQELSEFLTEEELYEFSLIKETVGIPESLNEFSLMNRSHKWDPKNPAPPVINIFFIILVQLH